MKNFRLLLLSFLTFLSEGAGVNAQPLVKCELKITTEITNTSASLNNGKIIVKPLDGASPYKYVFYEDQTGRQMQKDLSKESAIDLKKGKYHCLVIDNNGCTKQVEFTIQ
jgi:hypothetical protein